MIVSKITCTCIQQCLVLNNKVFSNFMKSKKEDFDQHILCMGCISGGHGRDLSLCVFVWEATEGNLSSKVSRHLAIFDINRWYHAQMPPSIRLVGN